MGVGKLNIKGSSYLGAYATATDKNVFIGRGVTHHALNAVCAALDVKPIEFSIADTDMIGVFARANSNGIVLSGMIEEREVAELKRQSDINICVLKSSLNAVGNNILANDRVAIVNPDYDSVAAKAIGDALGVEVLREIIGGFKTTGASNILTNKGLIINNRATDQQKEKVDKATGFQSESSTANTGSLSIGLGVLANSNGIVAGDETTGYELARIMQALELND